MAQATKTWNRKTHVMADSYGEELGKPLRGWRLRLYIVIFEADDRLASARTGAHHPYLPGMPD